MTLGVACHHHLWTAHSVERCVAWHDIIALELHPRSDDIKHGMKSPPLDSTHSRQRRHHRYWTARMVGRHRAWHDITALGQHTRSDYVEHGMTSPPLYSTHDQTTSGVACHHGSWTARMVGLRRAWHDITTFGQHTRSNDAWHGITSSPLNCTHGRTTSGMA